MTRDGDIRAIITREDIIQHSLGADILIRARLGHERLPVRIVLREALLELVAREVLVDVALVAPAIAGVRANALTKELFHSRHERALLR